MEKMLNTFIDEIGAVIGVRAAYLINNRGEILFPQTEKLGRTNLTPAGGLDLVQSLGGFEVAGEETTMTATEFKLLHFLMSRANRVQTRDTLLTDVWGYSEGVDSRTVDTHVRRLRRKLGPEAARIETIVGVGYRFRT